MTKGYTANFLKMLRNDIPIDSVIIDILNMEIKHDPQWLRFRCPKCYNFHTATNDETNLARCFDCKRNFNPIDLVMAVGDCNFVDAVERLKDDMDQ